MKKNYYTYGYLTPAPDNILYYIGKGKNNRAYGKHGRVPVPEDRDLIIFFSDDLTTYHKEPQYFTEEKAFDLEIKGIAKYGRKDLGEGYQLGKIYRRENSIPDYRRKKWICNPNYLDDLSDWDGP